MSVPVQTRRFEGAGLTLAADTAGDPGAPSVLFMHGGGQTRHSWGRAVVEAAARGYHGVAIDLRGHGDSDWSPDGRYPFDRFADDARAVIAQLGRPVAVVGASLGGVAALMVSGERLPAPNAGVVLVDVTPRLETRGVEKITQFMRASPDGFASPDEAVEAVARYQPHRPRPSSSEGLMKNLRLRPDGRWRWHWDPAFIGSDHRPDPDAYRARLEEAARHVSIPMLLVRGGMSEVVSPESARELLALAPNAEMIDVAGADHMVAGDQNDAFNQAVFAFLERKIRKTPS